MAAAVDFVELSSSRPNYAAVDLETDTRTRAMLEAGAGASNCRAIVNAQACPKLLSNSVQTRRTRSKSVTSETRAETWEAALDRRRYPELADFLRAPAIYKTRH